VWVVQRKPSRSKIRALVFFHSLVEPERQRFGCSAQREPMLAGMIFPHLMHVLNI
jgi:hypothetical protein